MNDDELPPFRNDFLFANTPSYFLEKGLANPHLATLAKRYDVAELRRDMLDADAKGLFANRLP
jgi:hypothetical protein